jgi:hypothetical protein
MGETYGRKELKEREHMEDIGKEGRIFIWVLIEQGGIMWNEFICL